MILDTRDDVRRWKALTNCAAGDQGDRLSAVLFTGTRAYATDRYVLGRLHAPVELPADVDRVLVPARLLRDALGLAKGEQIRFLFRPGALHLVFGQDPLPFGDGWLSPEVTIPYREEPHYPETDVVEEWFAGDGTIDPAAHALSINAEQLVRLARLAPALDDMPPRVTMRLRPEPSRLVEVHDATGAGGRLGVMTQVPDHALDEELDA